MTTVYIATVLTLITLYIVLKKLREDETI